MHFFFKNFHVSLSLDKGKQFSLTQCLALTKKKKNKKKKNKEKNNKNLLFYFGKLKTCQVSSLASFLGRFFRLGLH